MTNALLLHMTRECEFFAHLVIRSSQPQEHKIKFIVVNKKQMQRLAYSFVGRGTYGEITGVQKGTTSAR